MPDLLIVQDFLGGAFLFLVSAITFRLVFRSILVSTVGASLAIFWGNVAELLIVGLIVVFVSGNPVIIFTAFGWMAAVFRWFLVK
ncbi:MAG: hypothetical protein GX964_10620 [Syntrophomonadaceae bacterium]|nr:hypothetical protein [Syntrophomonadaceae bacterium]